MALGHDFRRVLELVTGDDVHRQSSARRITQDQPETSQQMSVCLLSRRLAWWTIALTLLRAPRVLFAGLRIW